MTVKVSKPAINVREELADLKKPTGIAGQAMLAAETPQEQFQLIGAGRRNIVHNGDMRISQKAGGAAVTAHGTTNSPVDRFQVTENHSGGISWEQVQDAPKGFYHSIKSTVTSTDTSLASTEYARIFTRIEGQDISHLNWGTANAKPLTLSFWVKSSVTGTFDIAVGNGAGNKTLIIPYTIDSTNTWEYKTMLITPETTGTWATDNTLGLHLGWSLGSGSTYYTTVLSPTWIGSFAIGSSNGTNLAATNGATFYLTGVQLELGKVATPFEHRSYGEELALCQRYYTKWTIPTQWTGYQNAATKIDFTVYTPVPLRNSSPSLQCLGSFYKWSHEGYQVLTSPSILIAGTGQNQFSNNSILCTVDGFSGGDNGYVANVYIANLEIDDEL